MALELEGTIVSKMQPVSGESARGGWVKQEFILEYEDGKFPTKLCLNVWGSDSVNALGAIQIGEKVKVSLRPSSREYNGRWYTEIRAWRIDRAAAGAPSGYGSHSSQDMPYAAPGPQSFQSAPQPGYQAPVNDVPSGMDSFAAQEDDLPF